jgi:hypothetical protein
VWQPVPVQVRPRSVPRERGAPARPHPRHRQLIGRAGVASRERVGVSGSVPLTSQSRSPLSCRVMRRCSPTRALVRRHTAFDTRRVCRGGAERHREERGDCATYRAADAAAGAPLNTPTQSDRDPGLVPAHAPRRWLTPRKPMGPTLLHSMLLASAATDLSHCLEPQVRQVADQVAQQVADRVSRRVARRWIVAPTWTEQRGVG